MNLQELTKYLIGQMIEDKDNIRITQNEDDEFIILEVLVSKEEIGRVIGRNGKVANAIRTIVSSSAYLHYKKKIRININSF